MKIRTFFAALLLALFSLSTLNIPALAEEGMWTFNNVPREEIKKKYGLKSRTNGSRTSVSRP